MTEPDLTVDPTALDDELPPEHAAILRRADADLAEMLDGFAEDPGAFDAAWEAAIATVPDPSPSHRWPLLATTVTLMAVAASLAIVMRPDPVPTDTDEAAEESTASTEGCRPDGLELTAHKGGFTKRDLACLDRLVADGSLNHDHADRLRLVDLWNRGDLEGWQALAARIALSGDGDIDLAYKLVLQQGGSGDPELVLALTRIVTDGAAAWPRDVRQSRLDTVAALRKEAVRRLADAENLGADQGPTPDPPVAPNVAPPVETVAPRTGDAVVVEIPPGHGIMRLDIKCDASNERWRSAFADGRAVALHVPLADEDRCVGILKGAAAPMRIQVMGGMSYQCEVDQMVVRCEATPLGSD